jgi:(p)ppGpp synthase/HD superfamily hydrolase
MIQISENHLKAIKMSCVAHATKSYRGQPYYTHYDDVDSILVQYGFKNNDILRTSGVLHDTMEDCGFTYNDIKKVFGKEIADIVYLVTDFKGHNRTERKPDELYLQMRLNALAVTLKVADRIANARASIENNDRMGDTYKAEYVHFREMLYNPSNKSLRPMWVELDGLMGFTN